MHSPTASGGPERQHADAAGEVRPRVAPTTDERPAIVRMEGMSIRYGRDIAVREVTGSFPRGGIHGLLGRNGSGKTTLLSSIAAFRKPSAGKVLVGDRVPFENGRLAREICFVRESGDVLASASVRQALAFASSLRPRWDHELAQRLVDSFEIPLTKTPEKLSRGKRSALGMTIGLASGASLTMFDETHLGMDAPSRYRFYDELLLGIERTDRTFILSSHLISEIENLLESVLILDRGELLLAGEVDELRSRARSVTGPIEEVDDFCRGREVLQERTLGRTKQALVFSAAPRDATRSGIARSDVPSEPGARLEIGSISLQDLFVALTERRNDRVDLA